MSSWPRRIRALLLIGLFFGCRSPRKDPPSACNTIANEGPMVEMTAAQGEPPVAEGGLVVEGTYRLTAMRSFQGSMILPAERATKVFRDGKIETVHEVKDTGRVSRVTHRYVASGDTLDITPLCGSDQGAKVGYTATPQEIRIYTRGEGAKFLLVYSRAP